MAKNKAPKAEAVEQQQEIDTGVHGVMEEKLADKAVEDAKSVEPDKKREEKEEIDNTGKLFLRMFFTNPDKGNKIITKLRGKVYFPANPALEPDWYVATIVQERPNYGVMDTIPLDQVPIELWDPKVIHGIFIKKNYDKGVKEVYRSIPKDKLATDESAPIFSFPFEVPKSRVVNTTIGDVLKQAVIDKLKGEAAKTTE